jgi:hypothetical protein
MIDQVTRFISQVDGKVSHWFIENGTSIDAAEKMCLDFLRILAGMKMQQQQTAATPEAEVKSDTLEETNVQS